MYDTPGSVFGGLGWPVKAAATQAQAFLSPQKGELSSGRSPHVNPLVPARSSVTAFFLTSIRATAALAEIEAGAPPCAALMYWSLLIPPCAQPSEGSNSPPQSAVYRVACGLIRSLRKRFDEWTSPARNPGPGGGRRHTTPLTDGR